MFKPNNKNATVLKLSRHDFIHKESYPYGLTKREIEILEHLSNGLHYKSIAAKLFLSEGTVRNYCSKLYSKLDINNREEAIKMARTENIVQEQENFFDISLVFFKCFYPVIIKSFINLNKLKSQQFEPLQKFKLFFNKKSALILLGSTHQLNL